MLGARTILGGLVSILVIGSVWGQSQRPSRNQPPSNQATQPTAPDQRGTDQVPFTVKVLPAPGSQDKADKEEHDRKDKAIIDEKIAFETQRIADYTDRLAVFTWFLFCVAVSQAGLFLWQLFYMRQGVKDAGIAAHAALLNAQAVIDAERAYLFAVIEFENCTSILERAAKYAGTPAMDPTRAEGLSLTYSLTNFGKTPAILKQISHQLIVSAETPETYVVILDEVVAGVISAEKKTKNMKCSPKSVFTVADAQSVAAGKTNLWFYGYAIYDDVFGREIEFRYRWQCSGEGPRLDYHREFIRNQKNS